MESFWIPFYEDSIFLFIDVFLVKQVYKNYPLILVTLSLVWHEMIFFDFALSCFQEISHDNRLG